MMPQAFTTVGVRFVDEEYKQLDKWRASQPVIPSMSAAVRYFVQKGLEDELKKKKTNG